MPAAIVLNPQEPLVSTVQWFLVSGVVSGIIDLDVYVVVLVRARKDERLRPYRNLFAIFRDFRGFKDVMTETGTLAYGLLVHLMFMPVIAAFFYFLWKDFFIPALVGIGSHLITDLPNLKLLKRDKPSSY